MERKLLMSVENITMQYPGTKALDNVSLDIYGGEVLGLIGENGAGKSTLMKIMTGTEIATHGEMFIHGKPYAPHSMIEANQQGVGMVFQEQSLILNLTVAQNIFIGREQPFISKGLISTKRMYAEAQRVLDFMELSSIKPGMLINRLDFASRQMVEVAKVMDSINKSQIDGAVILLDEPTSVLSDQEIQQLFMHIKHLCAKGNAVVFVSHKLGEVMEIADHICVFKDGCKVAEMPNQDLDEGILYQKMVGRSASSQYYQVPRQRQPEDEIVLELKNLGRRGYFGDVDMQLHRGEIISVCGVVGSGKENLCAVICGDENATSGEIFVFGKQKRFRSPYEALQNGILSVPRERRVEGVVADLPAYENISLSNFEKVKKHRLISKRLAIAQADRYTKELSIKLPNAKQKVNFLSGGNAQKVVFARMLASDADILVLDHPTRGVDVGAKAEIYSIIRDLADQGKSMIILGDTLDESIGLANHIFVMRDGEVTRTIAAPQDDKPPQIAILKFMM